MVWDARVVGTADPALRAPEGVTEPGVHRRGGWRVGDRLRYRDDEVEIVGFVLGIDPSAAGDQSVEYALLRYPHLVERPRETADLVGATFLPGGRGHDPFHDVAGWKLSASWVEHFDNLMRPWPGEPDLARPAARLAQDMGETVLVTGGVVRDALRGATRRRGDVDLVGTLRPPAFRDLAVDVEVLPYGGRRGGPDDRWHLRTTGPERFVSVLSSDEEHSVDYAAMRIDYRPHVLSAKPVWIYGTGLAADASWRDVSCNALMYDPEAGWLYDPTEHGLRDLGLKPSDLNGDPPSVERRDVVLRPIDLPENAPVRHVALHVVRVVLLVLRLADGELDTRPTERWVRAHAEHIERALDHRDSVGDRVPLITKELRSLPRAADTLGLINRHRQHLSRIFAVADLWPQLQSILPSPGTVSSHLGPDEGPQPFGSALCALERGADRRWVAAAAGFVGPRRPTRAAAARYFRDDLVGYEHVVDDVVIDGRTLSDVLVLRPRHDEDGVRYLELDDALQPVRPTEQELARIRGGDFDFSETG